VNLSPHFTLAEMTVSQEAARSGLKNKPNEDQEAALLLLCLNVIEPLRVRVRRPVIVSSGFRSVTLNRRIGGSSRSQHCKGEAVDFAIPGMVVAEVVMLVRRMKLPFDQLIDEFGAWVHVSHARTGSQRGTVMTARHVGGKTQYRVI